MRKLRIGMIGCGYAANLHLDHLKKLEDIDIVAFADTNKERLEAISKNNNGAGLYSDYREMYDKEKNIDAVFIVVPPDAHGNAEILAAQKGIHMYIEKPVSISMDKAVRVEEAVLQSGVISSVGFQERYSDAVIKLKDYCQGRKIGLVNGRWIGGIPGAHWWRMKEHSGGQVVEQSIHIFDILRFLFGEAALVYSTAGSGLVNGMEDYDIEDFSATVVNFRNGVIATVLTGCYLEGNSGVNGMGLQVICSDSIAEHDLFKETRIIAADSVQKYPVQGNTYFNAVQAFINAIRENDRRLVKSDFTEGVKTLELVLAANESMASQMPVRLKR